MSSLTAVKTTCLLAKKLSSRCILHFRNTANAVDLRFKQRLIMGRIWLELVPSKRIFIVSTSFNMCYVGAYHEESGNSYSDYWTEGKEPWKTSRSITIPVACSDTGI